MGRILGLYRGPVFLHRKSPKYIIFIFQTDESDEDNQPPPAPIRHWPTLDLLITMTYKLGDFFACLSYIDAALRDNPEFEKGHKLKKRIYDECPYLDPDPKNWNKEPIITSFKWSQEPKPKPPEKQAVRLTISSWNLKALATSFFDRYEVCGDTELLLEPCVVEYEEKIVEEKEIEPTTRNVTEVKQKHSSQDEDDDDIVILGSDDDDDDDDVVILDDESDDNDITVDNAEEVENIESSVRKVIDTVIDNVIYCAHQRKKEHSFDIVSPIVSDLVDSVVEISTTAFIERILFNAIDSSVTENFSFVSNLSASKRKAGVSQFLSEVPLDLIEKRRSTRAKATAGIGIGERSIGTSGENTLSSPRCEEVTAKQLLQGYFPSSLLNINHGKLIDVSISPQKNISELVLPSIPAISLTAYEKKGSNKWLSCEEEKDFVEKFAETFCSSTRWNFLTQLEEFLATMVEKLGDRSWPNDLCNIYMKCYVRWRGHQHFPDEFAPQVPHRFIPVIIIANEILLQTKVNDDTKVIAIQKLNTTLSFLCGVLVWGGGIF